ncbi:MAG: DUF2341 domain-containing protein [Terrimicrobiaceae bacterium]|nr:DUF2341 domain-containing protein [Terrimicrobiaceae bacterium]
MHKSLLVLTLTAALAAPAFAADADAPWWDKAWGSRKPFTINTKAEGVTIPGAPGTSLVLVRLHAGNFNFGNAREDGSDLRFVSADGKTLLPHQIERWDALLNEAFVWVQVPEIAADGETKFWLYSGNAEDAEPVDPKTAYDDSTVLVYHFTNTPTPADATKNANNATTGGTLSEGALIAGGLRLLGNTAIKVPASESLNRTAGEPFTFSAWLKPTTFAPRQVLLQMLDGGNGLELGLADGVPYAEIVDGGSRTRTPAGEPLAANTWKHLAVAADGSSTVLYIDGKEYARLDRALPAFAGETTLGAAADGSNGAVGEIDEVQIASVARPAGWVAFAATNQSGTDAATQLMAAGEDEGAGATHKNETLEHMMLFGDIAKNMMFDGWIAVGICVVMMFATWWVAIKKHILLGKIKKGNDEFQRQWKKVAQDLTVLDHDDPEAAKTLGGASKKAIKLMHDSPLYHVYHIGAEEIRHRLTGPKKTDGLSARSIQAIRASLDAGMVHEQHRLTNGLVYITIGIAGGPYVGLLGTVVGVMITFALVAKYGEVDVNAIAPGIASALLATTVGLLVAIPALFIYSFLNTRIKEATSAMQVFIDEFIAKVAEFYPTPADIVPVPLRQIRTPEDAVRQEEKVREHAAGKDLPN